MNQKKYYFLDYITFRDFGPRKNITEKSKIDGRLGEKQLQHLKLTVNLYLEYTKTPMKKTKNQAKKRAKNKKSKESGYTYTHHRKGNLSG